MYDSSWFGLPSSGTHPDRVSMAAKATTRDASRADIECHPRKRLEGPLSPTRLGASQCSSPIRHA